VCHSTLDWRVIKKKKKKRAGGYRTVGVPPELVWLPDVF